MKRLLGVAGTIAALTYFFDREAGARRRAMLRDRALALFGRGDGTTEQYGGAISAEAYGSLEGVQHLSEEDKGPLDDVTLARKVESEIFRGQDVRKGSVNVNVENGVVVLRGQVESEEDVERLERRARRVVGVYDVDNLLQTAGTRSQPS